MKWALKTIVAKFGQNWPNASSAPPGTPQKGISERRDGQNWPKLANLYPV